MIRGRVVSFDRTKGYGFVAPDTGGEDVFVHVNDLLHDKSLMMPGTVVEFVLDEGDRGPKASSVTVVQRSSAPAARQIPADDDLCDVLSVDEFDREITELLLHAEPALTATQILDIRKKAAALAQNHGWLDT